MRMLGVSPALTGLLLLLTGCSQGLETHTFQSRLITTASPDQVFQAVQPMLRREFGPLSVDLDTHRIVTHPVEYQTSSDSGTARDLYRGRSTMRRVAHFHVGRRGDGSIARLRVEIERKDTDRREVFQPDQNRLSDAPSQTPIERDAATTTAQNTVWTFVKRDRRLERALLAELQQQFAPEPAAQPVADQPTEKP